MDTGHGENGADGDVIFTTSDTQPSYRPAPARTGDTLPLATTDNNHAQRRQRENEKSSDFKRKKRRKLFMMMYEMLFVIYHSSPNVQS